MSKPLLHLYIDTDDKNKLSDLMFAIDLLNIDLEIRSVSHLDVGGNVFICEKKYDDDLKQLMYSFNMSSLIIKRDIFTKKMIIPSIYHCRLSDFDPKKLKKIKTVKLVEHNVIHLDGYNDDLHLVFTPDYKDFISTPSTAFQLYEYHNAAWTDEPYCAKQFHINTRNNNYQDTADNLNKFKWFMWCGHNNIKVR